MFFVILKNVDLFANRWPQTVGSPTEGEGVGQRLKVLSILAYGNCARGTSGSQNRGVLSVFCEMHDALGSRFLLRFRMLQLTTPVFFGL